jgi:hypothetical protein
MNVALVYKSRIPRGPHFYPVAPEHACDLINDGHVVARTHYAVTRHEAFAAALALAKRRGFRIINLDTARPAGRAA